jgi:hypothetical protein
VANAEQILKLKGENRSMKFQEAKEKFRRHKANLAKKASRTQSASSGTLPSLAKGKKRLGGKSDGKSKGGNFTSRSAGNKELPESASDSKLAKVKQKRNKMVQSPKKGALPSISTRGATPTVASTVPEGDVDSVASLEGSIDSITDVIDAKNSVASSNSVTKKKKKKKKKEFVNRTTKKEQARLELLKEIAEKKEKEERRYKSRKRNQEMEWSNVRVGNGGEEKDMKVFRDKERRARMLIEEYEREMSKQQEYPVSTIQTEKVIDRPDWDSTAVNRNHKTRAAVIASAEEEESEEEEEEDLIVVEAEVKKSSASPFLKPTITLEMLQQHKQHLQAMHLKHLEVHIDNQNAEAQSRPPTKEAPLRASISKDMLEKHKKHVLSLQSINSISVIEKSTFKDDANKLSTNNKVNSCETFLPLKNKFSHHTRDPIIPQHSSTIAEKSKTPFPAEISDAGEDYSDNGDDCDDYDDADQEVVAAKPKGTVHHAEDIDLDDGIDSNSLCSSQEYAEDDFDVDSQVVDDDDVETPGMIDVESDANDGVGEEIKQSQDLMSGSLKASLIPNLSTIVSQDTYDCNDDDKDAVARIPQQDGTSASLKLIHEEGDGDVEIYDGFDSFMDSLQEKASEVKHSSIALLSVPSDNVKPTARKRHIKLPKKAKALTTKDEDEVDELINSNGEAGEEEEEVDDDICFDDEDDTPYDVDLYSATIRCSPVTVDQEIEEEGEGEGEENCCRVHSPKKSPVSSPARAMTRATAKTTPLKRNVSSAQAPRGIELLRSGSGAPPSRGSPGGSRGGGRRSAGKSNRLDPYENVRPASRSLRPLSRSSVVTSSGSVRRGLQSQSQSRKLEQYDNAAASSQPARARRSGPDPLEGSGQLSAGGVFSPPSSATRRRKRSENINKLEVIENHNSTPSTPEASRNGIIGSRSSIKKTIASAISESGNSSTPPSSAIRRRKRSETENKLVVVKPSDVYTPADANKADVSSCSGVEVDSVGVGATDDVSSRQDSNAVSRQPRGHDSNDKDQQNRANNRFPYRRNESLSKKPENIDSTPSMLDLNIMKFNGKVKMTRMDSFAKLSKKIIQQQESNSPSSISPNKIIMNKKSVVQNRRRSSATSGK